MIMDSKRRRDNTYNEDYDKPTKILKKNESEDEEGNDSLIEEDYENGYGEEEEEEEETEYAPDYLQEESGMFLHSY